MLIIRESGGVTPPSGAVTYTVQRNDNLTEIAARFGTTVAELVRLNNIANPNLIYPGQVLIIRESGGSTPPSGTTTYTVQRGDTLSEIAARFGTTVSALVLANNIADRDRIYPGQVLIIPVGGCVDNYIVQRGDTLSEIAQRFGTTVARLGQPQQHPQYRPHLHRTGAFAGHLLMEAAGDAFPRHSFLVRKPILGYNIGKHTREASA